MTLVVAEKIDGHIRVTADSELTEADGRTRRSGYALPMALKPVLLHPGLCVAYAGRAEDALQAIRNLGVDPHTGFRLEEIRHALLRAHQAGGRTTDFLIASLLPMPSLIKVANGESIECARAYLGLPRAYDAYHRAYELAPGGDGTASQQLGSKMEAAMEAIIEDDSVEGVGGFCIRAASDYCGGFTYLASAIAATGQVKVTSETPAGTVIPMPLLGTRDGGYRYAISATEQPGIGALGIYFQPGDFGCFLFPRASLYPIQFSQVTHDTFLARVEEKYGIRLHNVAPLRPVEEMANPFAIHIGE